MNDLLNYYLKIIKEKNITFIIVNIISLFVIFYLLDGPNDSFFYRVLYYVIALFLGGWIAFKFVSSTQDTETSILKKVRNGSIISLVLITSSLYFRTNETSEAAGRYDSTGTSTESSSESHTCGKCGNTFSGNGWQTVGGEQYQPTSWSGYGYCSSQCAYDSQPNKWK